MVIKVAHATDKELLKYEGCRRRLPPNSDATSCGDYFRDFYYPGPMANRYWLSAKNVPKLPILALLLVIELVNWSAKNPNGWSLQNPNVPIEPLKFVSLVIRVCVLFDTGLFFVLEVSVFTPLSHISFRKCFKRKQQLLPELVLQVSVLFFNVFSMIGIVLRFFGEDFACIQFTLACFVILCFGILSGSYY